MHEQRLVLLNPRELPTKDIQLAIDMYISELGESKKENSRLNKLVDELLNENKKLKEWKDWYQEKYDSD